MDQMYMSIFIIINYATNIMYLFDVIMNEKLNVFTSS